MTKKTLHGEHLMNLPLQQNEVMPHTYKVPTNGKVELFNVDHSVEMSL